MSSVQGRGTEYFCPAFFRLGYVIEWVLQPGPLQTFPTAELQAAGGVIPGFPPYTAHPVDTVKVPPTQLIESILKHLGVETNRVTNCVGWVQVFLLMCHLTPGHNNKQTHEK